MNIGNIIRELRKQRGITQEQLANSIGVSFQAVSKWENNIALPDITLAPVIASYFGVSMDALFDYDIGKVKDEVTKIANESAAYREHDTKTGVKLIEAGLKKYPDNDILLENLLYLINYTEDPDKTIEIALKIIGITEDAAIKYDALRFLAYAYKSKGDTDAARAALMQIPEIYFSRLSELAYILDGEEKLHTAGKQISVSIETLTEMQGRIVEYYEAKGDRASAAKECERAINLLALFEAKGKYWEPYINFFQKKMDTLNTKN